MQQSKSKLWLLCINASLGGFIFGYNLVVFNVTQENVSYTLGWGDNKDLLLSISGGLLFLGGWIGSLLSGKIALKIGRRRGLMISSIIGISGSLMTSIPLTYTFVSGRFVSGVSVGLFLAISPIYVSEMSPPSLSGKSGSFFSFQLVAGIVVGALQGLLLPEDTSDGMNDFWIFMYAFQCIVLFPQLLILKFLYKFDTPYWYILQGNIEEAQHSMRELKRIDIMSSMANPTENDIDEPSYKELFCSRKFSKLMRVGITIVFYTSFNGVIFFDLYSARIFNEIGYSMFYARLFTLIVASSESIGITILYSTINKLGRKTLMVSGALFVSLDLGLMCIFLEAKEVDFMIVILSFVYKIIIGYSNALSYIYLSEILDSKELGFNLSIGWILNIILGTVCLYSLNLVGVYGNFLFFCVACLLIGVHLIFEMIETQNLTREEIKALFFRDWAVVPKNEIVITA